MSIPRCSPRFPERHKLQAARIAAGTGAMLMMPASLLPTRSGKLR